MKTLEESVMAAMDGSDQALLPYLPYILQDFWEIGTDPEIIISLIKKHADTGKQLNALDLGCGKGAVSVKVASILGCKCYGIDAIPDFISFASFKATEYGVKDLCRFEVGDIREKIKKLDKYDIVILGAIGQVFGNYHEILNGLKSHLNGGGFIIIDDGYIEDGSNYKNDQYFRKSELNKQISDAGMFVVEEIIATEETHGDYDSEYNKLSKRCEELAEKYPEKEELFLSYREKQKEEYGLLKSGIICSTMVLKNA